MTSPPYRLTMLEPRGADSSMFESATDDSARVVMHARDALSQGRIADALQIVERAREDDRIEDSRLVSLARTGLLAKRAFGDLRGASTYSRDLTNLMRVRGVVGAAASFGLGEFAAARAARLEAQIRTDLAGWILLLQPHDSARAIYLLRSAERYAREEELAPLLSRVR